LIIAFAKSTDLSGTPFKELTILERLKFLERLGRQHRADSSKFIQSKIEIIQNVQQFYENRYDTINGSMFIEEPSDHSAVFCVSACPQEYPYKNDEYFCTAK
jgi:hypothetical protein